MWRAERGRRDVAVHLYAPQYENVIDDRWKVLQESRGKVKRSAPDS
jgi:hypothetical protein